jgi:arginine/lysine/histidine/glutamine transport system substrate-binding/permease protein
MDVSFRSHAKQMFGAAAIIMLTSLSHVSVAWSEDPKPLSFATDPTYPPFEFSKDGALVGFDIDLLTAIGKAAGFKAKLESLPFDGIIPALKAGSYDGAIAAMVATEERAKTIDFSKPYFKTGLVIIVRADNTTINGKKDLEGQRIAVEIGSAPATLAGTIPGAKVLTFNGSNAPLLELANGNADAVIGDELASQYAITAGQAKGLKVVPGYVSTDVYGIAFPKGSENVDLVNRGLQKVIDSGEYAEIYKQWFKTEPPKF